MTATEDRRRILFVMRHPAYVRQFEAVIDLLAARGHRLHLAFQILPDRSKSHGGLALAERLETEHESLTLGRAGQRADDWAPLVFALRRGVDYLRYLSPPYRRASALRTRRGARAPRLLVGLASWPLIRTPRGAGVLQRVLRRIERAVPSNGEIEAFLRSHRPDLLLVTPLVREPTQTDFVRSAQALELRCGLCVASWDNLTNKGIVQAQPDRVYVWNEAQVKEAIELHGVSAERVVATGAHTFDQWFGRRPSTSAGDFRRRCGLETDKPILLYLCSSGPIADNESTFVDGWLDALRSSTDARLRTANVLIRPHPSVDSEQWRHSRAARMPGVVVWPPTGTHTTSRSSQRDYFDSIYHSSAVVGLNTTGLIESAIVGRPVFTVLMPENEGGQEGTLHFHYLTTGNGGPLTSARSFDQHLDQLALALTPNGRGPEELGFLRAFVRPRASKSGRSDPRDPDRGTVAPCASGPGSPAVGRPAAGRRAASTRRPAPARGPTTVAGRHRARDRAREASAGSDGRPLMTPRLGYRLGGPGQLAQVPAQHRHLALQGLALLHRLLQPGLHLGAMAAVLLRAPAAPLLELALLRLHVGVGLGQGPAQAADQIRLLPGRVARG